MRLPSDPIVGVVVLYGLIAVLALTLATGGGALDFVFGFVMISLSVIVVHAALRALFRAGRRGRR